MRYSWKQIQGPKVKLAHDDDAVASFEAPNVPSGKSQLELQFSLTVTDGESTDKDTVSVSVRQDGSQDSKVDDEKARQSAAANDNQKSSNGKAGRDQIKTILKVPKSQIAMIKKAKRAVTTMQSRMKVKNQKIRVTHKMITIVTKRNLTSLRTRRKRTVVAMAMILIIAATTRRRTVQAKLIDNYVALFHG